MGIMKQLMIEQWDKEDRECCICANTGDYKRDDSGRFDAGGGVKMTRCIVCDNPVCEECIDEDEICQMCIDRVMRA